MSDGDGSLQGEALFQGDGFWLSPKAKLSFKATGFTRRRVLLYFKATDMGDGASSLPRRRVGHKLVQCCIYLHSQQSICDGCDGGEGFDG
jgi:hypothetical protein